MTTDSSATARFLRVVVANSVLCGSMADVLGWLRQTRERLVLGLGGRWSTQKAVQESHRLNAIAARSRLICAASSLAYAVAAASRTAVVKNLLRHALAVNRVEAVQLSAYIIF